VKYKGFLRGNDAWVYVATVAQEEFFVEEGRVSVDEGPQNVVHSVVEG
jgi:hypothetical protein